MHGLNAIQLSYRGRYEIIQLLLDNGADPKDILHETYIAESVDQNILKLLMEYAIRDPDYQPNKNTDQRVKDIFTEYKQNKKRQEILINKINLDASGNVIDSKHDLNPDVQDNIKKFLDGSGKRKSRKSKAKKTKKANKTVKRR